MKPTDFYPLDIVREPKTGAIGIVVQANGNEKGGHPVKAAVSWMRPWRNKPGLYFAWWDRADLEVIDTIPMVLTESMNSHGLNDAAVEHIYGERFHDRG